MYGYLYEHFIIPTTNAIIHFIGKVIEYMLETVTTHNIKHYGSLTHYVNNNTFSFNRRGIPLSIKHHTYDGFGIYIFNNCLYNYDPNDLHTETILGYERNVFNSVAKTLAIKQKLNLDADMIEQIAEGFNLIDEIDHLICCKDNYSYEEFKRCEYDYDYNPDLLKCENEFNDKVYIFTYGNIRGIEYLGSGLPNNANYIVQSALTSLPLIYANIMEEEVGPYLAFVDWKMHNIITGYKSMVRIKSARN